MRLCADIGGTKALLAIAGQGDTGQLQIHLQHRYTCADYSEFAPMLADFMAMARARGVEPTQISGGCLAVAGPVDEDAQFSRMTNLPWSIDAAALARQHGCGPLQVVNDFVAAAAGIEAIAPADLLTLQAGAPLAHGPRLVVGAGTGLGVAMLVWQDKEQNAGHYRILPGEGGHSGFAPINEEQAALWSYLHARAVQSGNHRGNHSGNQSGGRVTAEHVVSGPGLLTIYDFLCSRHGADQADPRQASDPAAALSELAAAQPQSVARQALDLFFGAYGAFAGDLALTLLARGGVYIAGGIAARLPSLLRTSPFLTAFNDKAEHAALAAQMPLHVIADAELGLKGAALLALRQG